MRASLVVLLTALAPACGDDLAVSLPPSDAYAERCATPRSGIDPATGEAYPDRPGTLADEKTWVRSWIDEYYLWYREVPSYRGDDYATVVDYFDVLKTEEKTASGNPKDRFHFVYPTDTWEALSQAGVEAGYGVRWAVIAPRPPREVVVAYTEPGSSGAGALTRGTTVRSVDGVDMVNGDDVTTLNAGLFPVAAGESHTFVVQDLGAATSRTITLVAADVTSTPVQNVKTIANGDVGYLQFNDHILTAEAELVQAIDQLRTAGVKDLVIDLRYNGGGYLAIASELAYMIAGPATAGHAFERLQFNDKYPSTNPFTGEPLTPTPFEDTSVFAATPAPLPTLGLTRVFVLTGANTCSASESIINGLLGIGVQVIQIGTTTCGKPYGFYPQDNCGTTFFAIQFQGVNEQGFGDYADGFTPGSGPPPALPGCVVADDFTHALGDPEEARLAAALLYRSTGSCPLDAAPSHLAATEGRVIKPAPLENRIYVAP